MSQQPEGPSYGDDVRASMNIIFFIARVWATSLEVFLHFGMGIRYPGGPGACVMIFVPIFACFFPHEDPTLMPLFLLNYVAVCVAHRIAAWQRSRRRFAEVHSFYNGYPYLCRMCGRLTEGFAKQVLEPAVSIAIGYLLLPRMPSHGWYLIGGGICMFLSFTMTSRLEREQALDMQDAMLEQNQFAERFRKTQYDN